jgi:hypothetical protein
MVDFRMRSDIDDDFFFVVVFVLLWWCSGVESGFWWTNGWLGVHEER